MFSGNEIATLLVLWLIFLQRFGHEEMTYVELGDVVDMQQQYGISMSPNELKSALRTFKRFSLINLVEVDISDKTIITLYPTLQFAMNKDQFAQVVEQMVGQIGQSKLPEDNVVEEEDE